MVDKIVIIDYNMGNVKSLANMARKIGVDALITSKVSEIEDATKIILPGVGSFDAGVQNVHNLGIKEVLNKKVHEDKVPVLGICLGMQLFGSRSEEGQLDGFGWIPGAIKRFDFQEIDNSRLKIPHMGWNKINPVASSSIILSDIPEDARFYFVHSYHYICANNENISATTRYGYDFTCSVKKDNIYGVQFHPEKSHKYGMHIMNNFLKLT
jgi:imidazole glycerol-phosphate synthase subunit HisH